MKLKRCPFCGSKAYEKYRDIVNCSNGDCFIQYTDFDIKGWNTRAIDPRLKKAVKKMRKFSFSNRSDEYERAQQDGVDYAVRILEDAGLVD